MTPAHNLSSQEDATPNPLGTLQVGRTPGGVKGYIWRNYVERPQGTLEYSCDTALVELTL
jgi:hypothetical protein